MRLAAALVLSLALSACAAVRQGNPSVDPTATPDPEPVTSIGPDLGLASFRVAPDVALTADITEIEVLVTERACNSGEDASGRIEEPVVTVGAESVTVVFAVRPRGGGQDCPSNPETPYVLVLDEPLGDLVLLDGSEVPPRDATECADPPFCSP